jgi:dephospho-CoA kinase
VGLTGGIGSGKSTVARRFAELGAVVIDADQVAREVVEPGEPTLARIRDRFGAQVISADGSLDRAGLAALAFPDPEALAALNAITGPAILERVAELRAKVPNDRVSVFDMPLLVERRLWVHEHLTVVVDVDVETRVKRLVEFRGLDEADVRHRMTNQASDEERRAVADVVIDNSGSPDELVARVDRVWHERIAPYAANLLSGIPTCRSGLVPLPPPPPDRAARGARVVARLVAALEPTGLAADVEHVGSTAVPGASEEDVIEVRISLGSAADAERPELAAALRDAGYVPSAAAVCDTATPVGADPVGRPERCYAGCDPGQVVRLNVNAPSERVPPE